MEMPSMELPDITVERVLFETFWARSRFASAVPGLDLAAQVRGAIDEMEHDGGFATFFSCWWRGHFGGSIVVFKDPWYRSKGREDVACFGLVTASNTAMLDALIGAARHEAKSNGYDVLRGPVNPPRSLFGYGVQVDGFDQPLIAGSSADPVDYAAMFEELDEGGTFESHNTYLNFVQDFEATEAFIASIDLDRSLRVVNPDFDNLGDLPAQVATLMNESLGTRPDFETTSPERLAASAMMYKIVPGGEKLLGLYFDGDVLAGGVIMQPDWFEVLAGKPLTQIAGDIYMLGPAYRGKWMQANFAEYSIAVLRSMGIDRLEHASGWENAHGAMANAKHGLIRLIKSFRVYELRA